MDRDDGRGRGLTLFSRAPLALLLALAVAGCGGGEDEDGGDDGAALEELNCAIPVRLSGAVEHEIPAEDLACLYPWGTDSGISTTYAPFEGPVETIELEIEGITQGETGEFPASVTIRLEDGRSFEATDCTVSVTSHEPTEGDNELRQPYVLRGSGSCAAPATAQGDSSGAIELAPFQFVAGTAWPL